MRVIGSEIQVKRTKAGWGVFQTMNAIPFVVFPTQKLAIKVGSLVAKNKNVRLLICNMDGDVRRLYKYEQTV
jgi:hypothetical protein